MTRPGSNFVCLGALAVLYACSTDDVTSANTDGTIADSGPIEGDSTGNSVLDTSASTADVGDSTDGESPQDTSSAEDILGEDDVQSPEDVDEPDDVAPTPDMGGPDDVLEPQDGGLLDVGEEPDGDQPPDAGPDADTSQPDTVQWYPPNSDRVFYAGSAGHQRLQSAIQLADGSFLVAGSTNSLEWVPDETEVTVLSADGINGQPGGDTMALLARLSPQLNQVWSVFVLPAGAATEFRHVKQSAAGIYVSGTTSVNKSNPSSGYFIAKLSADFPDSNPTSFEWIFNVWATSQHRDLQPWDVDDEGRVTYVRGQSYDFDWASVHRLGPDGTQQVVEHWRQHWGTDPEGNGGELRAAPASEYEAQGWSLTHSGIVFKPPGRCDLRSHTQEAFDAITSDGNGGTRQGTWPNDSFYTGPCDPSNPTTTGPGYTGYKATNKTHRVGSIVVNKATGDTYIGYSIQSTLPGGNPDFEPAVIAYGADGQLKWWSRLYEETTQNSSPDQYVDYLAVDPNTGALVVGARCHGNNVVNFWEGNTIAGAPNASAFQNQFTGTSGNIHISWLGRFDLNDGTLLGSTYLAEYANGMSGVGATHPDPNLDGWPNPNAGWPKLNTTRLRALAVDEQGDVYVTAIGRRTITTQNAFQTMPNTAGTQSGWNHFARVYPADFSTLKYSSILRSEWDQTTDGGSANIQLSAVLPTQNGLLVVGWSEADDDGYAKGEPMPTAMAPDWGSTVPLGEDMVFGYLTY